MLFQGLTTTILILKFNNDNNNIIYIILHIFLKNIELKFYWKPSIIK